MKNYKSYHLQKINTDLYIFEDNSVLIWCTHDKNYQFGSYYLIKDNKIKFVIDTEKCYKEINL